MNQETIEMLNNEFYRVSIIEEGLIHIHFKNTPGYDIEKHKSLLKFIEGALEYKKGLFVISLDPFMNFSDELKNFISSKEGAPLSIADAIIIDNTAKALLGNFYLKMNTPVRPTKLFKNTTEAIVWLKSFK